MNNLTKLLSSCFQSISRIRLKKSKNKNRISRTTITNTIETNCNCNKTKTNANQVHDNDNGNENDSPESIKISISDPSNSNKSSTSTSTFSPLSSDSLIGDLIPPVPVPQRQKKSISWSHFKQVFPIYALTPEPTPTRKSRGRTYPFDKRDPYQCSQSHHVQNGMKPNANRQKNSQWKISRPKLFNYYSSFWNQGQDTGDYSSPPASGRSDLVIDKTKVQEKDVEIEKIYSTISDRKNTWLPGDRIYFHDTKEIGEIVERGLRGPRSNLVLKVRYLNQDFSPNRLSVMSLLHAMCYGDLLLDTEIMDTYRSTLNPALSWTRL